MSEEMKNLNEQSEETVVETTETQAEKTAPVAEPPKPQFIEKKPLDKKTIGIIAGAAVAVLAIVGIILGIVLGGGTPHVHNYVNGVCECGEADPNYIPPNPPAEEKTYHLVLVTDAGLGAISKNKVTNITLAIVFDEDGKIVAAQFDSFEQSLKLTDGAIIPVDRITTKVEKGAEYTGMNAGSWEEQSAAFEAFIIGKTAAEIAALSFVVDGADAGLVAGCTMKSSMPVFQELVAKAAAYERKVAFTTAGEFDLGLAIDAKFTGSVAEGAKVSADFAAVVVSENTVLAAMLDSAEASFTYEGETASVSYSGSKNDLGEDYDKNNIMAAGDWYKQAQAFANSFVGKTVDELADLPASGVAGCTVYAGGYKATLIKAAENA